MPGEPAGDQETDQAVAPHCLATKSQGCFVVVFFVFFPREGSYGEADNQAGWLGFGGWQASKRVVCLVLPADTAA